MATENRRLELMETCMQVIAEKGLSAFSMKKVTKRVGVSEALIYRYFETKENLLNECFALVHRQIGALYDGFPRKMPDTTEEKYDLLHSLWITYITFLVKNDYRTIFYFEYRNSSYLGELRSLKNMEQNLYFKSFRVIYKGFNRHFHIEEKTSADHLWTYIMDTAGVFARRMIRGELPNTQESYENTWKLVFGGISGLLWGKSDDISCDSGIDNSEKE